MLLYYHLGYSFYQRCVGAYPGHAFWEASIQGGLLPDTSCLHRACWLVFYKLHDIIRIGTVNDHMGSVDGFRLLTSSSSFSPVAKQYHRAKMTSIGNSRHYEERTFSVTLLL